MDELLSPLGSEHGLIIMKNDDVLSIYKQIRCFFWGKINKRLIVFMPIFIVSFNINLTLAYTGECISNTGSTIVSNAELGDFNIDDSSSNEPGYIVVRDKEFVTGGLPYRAKCNIQPSINNIPIYMTTIVPLLQENDNWYSINEYLSVRSQTYIAGSRNVYLDNPFKNESNNYNEPNWDETNWSSGGRGKISLRIDKKFIGISYFSKKILNVYANAINGVTSTTPIISVSLSGKIKVPQSCELDGGENIAMDFGDIGAPLFSQAGAGNKPADVNPQTHTIAIKCKNIDAQALLSMRIETNSASGSAMVSDNKDVGFIVAGSDKTPLKPNNINSKIKFHLDDNSAATVPITAWPVSITGNQPAEGKFTAEGYLRIDFD